MGGSEVKRKEERRDSEAEESIWDTGIDQIRLEALFYKKGETAN